MFTGIVEEKGVVWGLQKRKNLFMLTVSAQKVFKGLKIGESVAIDGVCLTAVSKKGSRVSFDVMKETLRRTTLKNLQKGSRVNLERSLRFGGRLGGHFVLGHVDGVGSIAKKIILPNYVEFQIVLDKKLMRYLVPKGSVCIDGISLTIGQVNKNRFSVYIIPHTLEVTTLGLKKVFDFVNIETDIIAKYITDKKKLAGLFQKGYFRYNRLTSLAPKL